MVKEWAKDTATGKWTQVLILVWLEDGQGDVTFKPAELAALKS